MTVPNPNPCRMRFRAELASNDWIVDYNDVTLSSTGGAAASSVAFRSMVSLASESNKKKLVHAVTKLHLLWCLVTSGMCVCMCVCVCVAVMTPCMLYFVCLQRYCEECGQVEWH